MSTNDSYDSPQDADRTMLVPNPGGRRNVAPAPVNAPSPSPLPSPLPSVPMAVELHGSGLNPIARAANPLLDLVVPLRHMAAHTDLQALRSQLVQALRNFESELKACRVDSESIAAARYMLCTFLDETISGTPWGSGGVWSSHSLLVAFHNEAWGGEKVFLILQRLSQDPRANLHVLELMYLCLALGLEGRYRVLDGGRDQLEMLRERLLQMIQTQRGVSEQELSVHWRGVTDKRASLLGVVPLWVLAAIAGAFLVILHLVLSYQLNGSSDPVFADLSRIKVERPVPKQVAVVVPAPPPPVRLAGFLAPEIAQGLVTVNDTADRSIVTLRGDGVFASGSADVARDFNPLLERIGDALKTVPGKVIVVGHTDNVRSFSTRFPSNWDLSKARAASVLKMLSERAGPVERYTMIGRGDTEPLMPNDTAANRARNRRVEIIVLAPSAGQ